jgi:hypothetical protein
MKRNSAVKAIAAVLLLTLCAQAEQFTFMRGTNQVWDYPDKDGSAPMVDRPDNDNWTSPVNYYQGAMYMKYEVLEKPSDKTLGVQLCFWMPGWSPETCSNQLKYGTEGTYYHKMGNPSGWWHHGDYPWEDNDFYKARLFQKDGNDGAILMATSSCGSYCYSGDLSAHVPIKYNVEIIVVAKGDKLAAPDSWECPESWECSGGATAINFKSNPTNENMASYYRVNSLKQLNNLYENLVGKEMSLYTSQGKRIESRYLNEPGALLFAHIKTAHDQHIKAVVMLNK